jgi:outer membrane protein OmpA-like peptidoglycan-associated protein
MTQDRVGRREFMIANASKVVIAGAMALSVAGLGGCATKKFVRESIAPVQSTVSQQGTQIQQLDATTREALDRATAAGKLAEGKFVYSMVLSDDSMKFQTGKSDLSPEATARLDAFVDKLKTENKNVYVEVQGHTDSTGSPAGNQRLGQDRAEAVRRYLNQKGVALNRIGTISYGQDAPVAPNNTRDGRAQNRRVVLIVLN